MEIRRSGSWGAAHDFEKAVAKALELAARLDASYLPGWCGRSGDGNR